MPDPSKPNLTPPPRPRDHQQQQKPAPPPPADPAPLTTRDGENPYLDTEGGE